MTARTDKIASYLSARVTELAVERLRDAGTYERFGIVSVVSVRVSPDYSYADVTVDSITEADKLPKALAPIAKSLRGELSRKLGLHKSPIIRFRTKSDEGSAATPEERVLGLLDQISRKTHAGA